VGRETGCEVRLTDTTCSRRHFRILCGPEGGLVLEDLASANGTFVNGERTERKLLAPGDQIHLGETTIRFLSETELLQALQQRTMRVAERDPVTAVCSRRLFDMRLRTEITLAARSGAVVSVALVGLDQLCRVQAEGGERAAHRVLRAVALALGGYLRERDLLGRFDDDVFVALVLDPSPNVAYLVAERMCAGIEGLGLEVDDRPLSVTASIGVASDKGRRDLTMESLVDRARAELERAREAGGNCVSRWVHPTIREPIPAVSGDLRGTTVGEIRRKR
jgi:diguanylate cyclase (GGDEF)-like protein